MPRDGGRIGHVQTLRACARACKVEAARDDAARTAVVQMMEHIRTSRGPAASKRDAETAFKLYTDTFTTAAASDGPVPQAAGESASVGFRLRGRSFLFTYNYDFFNKALPDGTPSPDDAAGLWVLWLAWKKETKKRLGVAKSSSTLEESIFSKLPGRVHLHWKIDLRESIDHTTVNAFRFHGVGPDARSTWAQADEGKAARGSSYTEAVNRAHFYCWAPKLAELRLANGGP